jgi:hypothetical protein
MSLAASSLRQAFSILLIVVVATAIFSTGCGSSSMSKTPPLTGNTSVTVVVSSTANDQLAEFDLGFQSIALTSQSGQTVTLLSFPSSEPPLGAEFMHLNGTAQPLLTATIPQDIYTSATLTLGGGAFVCLALGQVDGEQTLSSATYSLFPPTATVNFPSPLTVTGTSMALSLDLLVSKSATIGDCVNVDGFSGFSAAPAFNFTPLNDNGTLRMDCAQVNDGVAFTTQPSASQQSHVGKSTVQQIHREEPGSLQQIISVSTQP